MDWDMARPWKLKQPKYEITFYLCPRRCRVPAIHCLSGLGDNHLVVETTQPEAQANR